MVKPHKTERISVRGNFGTICKIRAIKSARTTEIPRNFPIDKTKFTVVAEKNLRRSENAKHEQWQKYDQKCK